MTDTVKKAKAPAKPRKTAAKKEAAPKKENLVQMANPAKPSREEIERLARKYWAERGYKDGYAEQDWLRAERELEMAS